jgi:hypothetical protein
MHREQPPREEPITADEAVDLGSCSLLTTLIVIGFLFALSGRPLPRPTTIVHHDEAWVKGFRVQFLCNFYGSKCAKVYN